MQTVHMVAATTQDADRISRLIVSLMDGFIVPGSDTRPFLASVSPTAQARYISDSRYWYRMALVAGQLVGVIVLRDHCHLTNLFVAHTHQRQGLGQQLWQLALQHTQTQAAQVESLSVNAAPPAVPFYQKLGFVIEGAKRQADGVVFQPMRFVLR